MPMGFGAAFWVQHTTWPELREAVLHAEAAGFDHVWIDNHLLNDEGAPDAPKLEGWATLAAPAAITTRVRLGLMVAANTFRSPGVTAKITTTLDHVSGGRAIPGLGAGWFAREHVRTVNANTAIRDGAATAGADWDAWRLRHRPDADEQGRELIGTVDSVVAGLRAYAAVGVSESVWIFRTPFDRATMDRLAEVAPASVTGRDGSQAPTDTPSAPTVESSPATVGRSARGFGQQPAAHIARHGPSGLHAAAGAPAMRSRTRSAIAPTNAGWVPGVATRTIRTPSSSHVARASRSRSHATSTWSLTNPTGTMMAAAMPSARASRRASLMSGPNHGTWGEPLRDW